MADAAIGDKVRVVRTSEDESLVFCYKGTVDEEGMLQTVSGDKFDILGVHPDDNIYGWTNEVIVVERAVDTFLNGFSAC